MAGLLLLEKINNAGTLFHSPHKSLDPISGRIDHVAENLRYLDDHFDMTSAPTYTRGDKHAVTSLATVNSIVQTCHSITLSVALKTNFSDQLKLAEQALARDQDSQPPEPIRRPLDSTFLLDKSRLESLGLDSAFLPATGHANAKYTIYGNPIQNLTALEQRSVAMIFTWSDDLLYRVNQYVLAAFNQAFDLRFMTG